MGLAIYFNRAYSISAAKTMAVGFGDLCRQRRTHRPFIGGFFASALCLSAPLWAGFGGSTYGYAGFLCHQFRQAHQYSLPTSFGDGERVNKPDIGGHNMANFPISARPEQTHSPFPLAARAARKAARQWYLGAPVQSLAAWRDSCRQDHCHGLPNFDARGAAFDDAFAREIGNLIIGGGRANV